MKYNFKVNLTEELYKIFLEDENSFDSDKFNNIKSEFKEFRILYNDDPEDASLITSASHDITSDHFQVLLIGVKESDKTLLCYYYIGDNEESEWYKEGINDFKKILRYRVDD